MCVWVFACCVTLSQCWSHKENKYLEQTFFLHTQYLVLLLLLLYFITLLTSRKKSGNEKLNVLTEWTLYGCFNRCAHVFLFIRIVVSRSHSHKLLLYVTNKIISSEKTEYMPIVCVCMLRRVRVETIKAERHEYRVLSATHCKRSTENAQSKPCGYTC